MPGTIQDIGTNTFFYSKKLKKVVLPETLTEIGDNACNRRATSHYHKRGCPKVCWGQLRLRL